MGMELSNLISEIKDQAVLDWSTESTEILNVIEEEWQNVAS